MCASQHTAMYAEVPTKVLATERELASSPDKPKSHSFSWPWLLARMLLGFTSRWRIRCSSYK